MTENIIVTDCSDCPFYYDDSDYGSSCYHGVDLSHKNKDLLHARYGVGGCIHGTMPKECPLLSKDFSISFDKDIKQAYLK